MLPTRLPVSCRGFLLAIAALITLLAPAPLSAQARSNAQGWQVLDPGAYGRPIVTRELREYPRAARPSSRKVATKRARRPAIAARKAVRAAELRAARQKARLRVAALDTPERPYALPETRGLREAAVAAPTQSVVAHVDVKSQRMVVKVDGEVRHVWKVSTGRNGFGTPRGTYSPQRMHQKYFSRKYYNAPMPYSIFFRGGYAVHGTTEIHRLGRPASHGCVRLATPNARELFQLVRAVGPRKVRFVIT